MKMKALIAVRAGSQRVKNKNIRPFAESNLLTIKIEQLKRIDMLDGIIVNSDDDKMLEIAEEHGCEVFKREAYYASSSVSMSEVYKNMAENADTDIIVYTNVTNPLIEDYTIKSAILKYMEVSGEYDSLNTAHLIKEFLFQNGRAMNYDLKNQPRSQDLPEIYALNFAVNILSRQTMIKCRNVVGMHPYIYEIGNVEATDIDDMIDFDFAEYYYMKKR